MVRAVGERIQYVVISSVVSVWHCVIQEIKIFDGEDAKIWLEYGGDMGFYVSTRELGGVWSGD